MQPKTTTMEVSKNAGKTPVKAFVFIIFLSLFFHHFSFSQRADSTINHKRLKRYTRSFAAGYGLSILGMHYLWYKDSPQQSFSFFNDNAEWKQVDKLGHAYTSFYLSYSASLALNRCNIPARKSDLLGAATGFMILLPIEVFDGFSADYGASTGDLIANTGGAAFFLGQQYLWDEVRIYPKFSFHRTDYARRRPNLLGDNLAKEIFKDYNGQTYWLSADMDKFIRFPKWLNIAVGYGAHQMVFARDQQNLSEGFYPYRQYYLSLDLDLTSIRTRSKTIRTLLAISRAIKFPAPTLEFSQKKAHFHILYF